MDGKIIVSSIIDSTFAAAFPKLNLQIYLNFEDLIDAVSSSPIRTEKLYITEDVVRHNPSSSFTSLVRLTSSVFFKAKEIVFITPFDSPNIERINFLVKEETLQNVTIVKGELQKEFLLSVIRGDAQSNKTSVKRKEVIRHRRSEFIKDNRVKSVFEDKDIVHTEEERLFDIEDQEVLKNEILPVVKNGELIQITGLNDTTRSVFTVILAQFASGYGHYQIYNVINSVFSVLKKEIEFFIFETKLEFILPSFRTVAVIENDIISAIGTAYNTPPSADMLFAAVDRAIEGMAVYDSDILSSVVSEILEADIKIPIYKIKSLKLGGESFDLYRYVKG